MLTINWDFNMFMSVTNAITNFTICPKIPFHEAKNFKIMLNNAALLFHILTHR